MGQLVIRREYSDKLRRFSDTDLIKVVTGVRRCGKSTLLQMYEEDFAEPVPRRISWCG